MIFETVTDLAILWLGAQGQDRAARGRSARVRKCNAGRSKRRMLAQISRGAETWSVGGGLAGLA